MSFISRQVAFADENGDDALFHELDHDLLILGLKLSEISRIPPDLKAIKLRTNTLINSLIKHPS